MKTQKIIADTFVVSHNPEFVDNLGIERTLLLPSGQLAFYDKKTVEHYFEINTKKL